MSSLVKTAVIKVLQPAQAGRIAACGFVQTRGIQGRALRESLPKPPPKPAPFDYVNSDYSYITSLFDRTTRRLDCNSKVIVVDGPVASGKTRLAECLAADLNMKHFPEATMDIHYCRANGIDLRSFNDQVPEDTRTFDHVDFNINPCHRLAGNFQIMMYIARYSQYIDALVHLLNTGQGVVLERCPWSDFVFLEAMYRNCYISRGVRSVYYDLRNNSIEELLRPHLVIYLDISPNKVLEGVRCRNYPHEMHACGALTPGFLVEMERHYKYKYLRDISSHAELLVYDWCAGGDPEVVVEDIERLNFDRYTAREEPKMKDWRLPREVDWADARMKYTNQKHYLMNLFLLPRLDVPELITSADDAYEREQTIYSHPQFRYELGYNHGSNLFRNTMPKYTEYL